MHEIMTPLGAFRTTMLMVGLFLGAVYWLMPGLTRPDLYFAVTVAAGFRRSPAGISILRRYRTEIVGVSVLALAGIAACAATALQFMPLVMLAQLAASFLVFYRARARVLPHAVAPTSIREAEPFRRRRIPGGWVAACGPFLVLAACAAYLRANWQQIPLRFPVHWGLNGIPDRWSARTWTGVYLPLLTAAAILLPLTAVLHGVTHWVRPIHASGAAGARESRFRGTSALVLLAAEYFVALLTSWVALHPLIQSSGFGGIAVPLILLLTLLVVVIPVIALVRLGQGGTRVPSSTDSKPATAPPIGDRTDDRHWLLGVIYFNRDDPAVLVEKRFGIGYTLNFARPVSWTVIAMLVLLPLALVRFLH